MSLLVVNSIGLTTTNRTDARTSMRWIYIFVRDTSFFGIYTCMRPHSLRRESSQSCRTWFDFAHPSDFESRVTTSISWKTHALASVSSEFSKSREGKAFLFETDFLRLSLSTNNSITFFLDEFRVWQSLASLCRYGYCLESIAIDMMKTSIM